MVIDVAITRKVLSLEIAGNCMWSACLEGFYKIKILQCAGCLLYDRKMQEFKNATLNDRTLQLFRKTK